MAERTNISWADKTHNEWIGCTRISPGCDHCYAATMMADRYGRVVWGGPGAGNGTRVQTSEANRRKPFAWERRAIKDGTRPFVFGGSLNDFFDRAVDMRWRRSYAGTIRATPHLIWILLTKRPENVIGMVNIAFDGVLPANVAIMASAVNQVEADRIIPILQRIKAELAPAFIGLSIEPMLGAIELPDNCGLDWVICGGESGPGARPMHPGWARRLRDQCAEQGIVFHFKQHGEWMGYGAGASCAPDGNLGLPCEPKAHFDFSDGERVFRVGKKAAGHLLDGAEHLGRPTVPALQHQETARA